jgi:hypothetical protein
MPRGARWLLLTFAFLLAAPAAAQAAQRWAVVTSSGSVARSSGTTTATHVAPGLYEIGFPGDMTGCAYVATVGDPASGAVFSPIAVTVATAADDPGSIVVATYDQSLGLPADAPFHLVTFCGLTKDYAVVDSDGTLARGGNATAAQHLGRGSYAVSFDREVADCAVTATIGSVDTTQVGSPGEITVAAGADPQTVDVTTVDATGAPVNAPFHLAVDCGRRKPTAVINADGTTARGANVSSDKLSPTPGDGRYEVIFDQPVWDCAFEATVGLPDNSGAILDPVTISTAVRAGDNNGVFVFIHDATGATADEPFHLSVYC